MLTCDSPIDIVQSCLANNAIVKPISYRHIFRPSTIACIFYLSIKRNFLDHIYGNVRKSCRLQYIPRNMHTAFALLCFVVVIHWLIFTYPSGLLHWHCGNLTIAPVPAKQPWWIWINTSCEFIMNDCITTTKQSTTKPCAYFMGYTVFFPIVIFHLPSICVFHFRMFPYYYRYKRII